MPPGHNHAFRWNTETRNSGDENYVQACYMFIMDDHAVVQKYIVKDAKGTEKKRDVVKMVTRIQMGRMALRQTYWS